MLTRSAEHGRDGVFEATLSGKQLIAPTLPLSAMDVDRLMSGFEGDQPEATGQLIPETNSVKFLPQ